MDPWDEYRQAQRANEIWMLSYHWGEAYEISEALGTWRAVRLDNQVAIVASSPGELRDKIIADYSIRPVQRR